MNILDSETNRAELDLWSIRHSVSLIPVSTPAQASGSLLVSSLTVLTAAQFLDLLDRGVHICTLEGLEMRPHTGVGEMAAAVVHEVARALRHWHKQGVEPGTEAGLDHKVSELNAKLIEMQLALLAANNEAREEREYAERMTAAISEQLDAVGAATECDGRLMSVGERFRAYCMAQTVTEKVTVSPLSVTNVTSVTEVVTQPSPVTNPENQPESTTEKAALEVKSVTSVTEKVTNVTEKVTPVTPPSPPPLPPLHPPIPAPTPAGDRARTRARAAAASTRS